MTRARLAAAAAWVVAWAAVAILAGLAGCASASDLDGLPQPLAYVHVPGIDDRELYQSPVAEDALAKEAAPTPRPMDEYSMVMLAPQIDPGHDVRAAFRRALWDVVGGKDEVPDAPNARVVCDLQLVYPDHQRYCLRFGGRRPTLRKLED